MTLVINSNRVSKQAMSTSNSYGCNSIEIINYASYSLYRVIILEVLGLHWAFMVEVNLSTTLTEGGLELGNGDMKLFSSIMS